MPDKNQARTAPETEISVDLNAADNKNAVTRRQTDIAREVRDQGGEEAPARTRAEKDLFKRMKRLERNLTKQFDQRQAERDAAHQRQVSELQAKLDRVAGDRDGGDDRADVAHEAAVNALKEKLAAAYEKGDSAASADITLQISKLDAQYWAKKAQAAGVTTREDAARGTGQEQQRQQPAEQRAGKGPTAAGSRFITANEDWWDDPDFAVEQAGCNTIYLELVNQEGFDAKDDETFKEVAKRMKAKFPKLDVRAGRRGPGDEEDEDDDEDVRQREASQGTRRQAAAARIDDRGAATARDRGNRRTLTREEIATMKACRLDPDNDADVVVFLREAVALEAQS